MKALNDHEKSRAALARSVRTAVVVPSLFALGVFAVKQPQLAGFAVFGTFAHQMLVNYDNAGTARFAQSALLTLLGAFMISLGTFVSGSVWLAVAATVAAGFASELPLMASGHIAIIRRALFLSFMLAVATPAPFRYVLPYLAGWLMAGIIAQPALLVIWSPPQNSSAAPDGASSHARSSVVAFTAPLTWIGNALGT